MPYGDLTTLADVKAWLQTGQAAFPTTDDALLSRLITAASQFIQTWLNRPIAQADYLEVRDGTGGSRLQFAVFPVTSVFSLTIDGIAIPPSADPRAAGYTYSATELALRGYIFTRRAQNVAFFYTAGFAAIPPEIAQACIELVALRYRERSRTGEVSKALGNGETVTYSQGDMSASIATLLAEYRAVAPTSGVQPRLAPTATDAAILAVTL
jgi:hypothetical protein